MTDADRARLIHEELRALYPEIRPLLAHANPFQLLVSVILSAQTTDAQVNKVTAELFRLFPGPEALAVSTQSEVEALVRSLGYYRVKARHIRETSAALVRSHGGKVPATMEELTALPGVGRKSANVVLATIFGKPATIVDTHFGRVVRRLGFTNSSDPARVEADLDRIVSADFRTAFSMRINFHGRACCKARAPACPSCVISRFCPFDAKTK